MKFFGRFFMPALLSMCFVPIAARGELPTAAPDEVGMSAEKLDLIEPAMQKALEQHAAAGIITMVARHGKVVYTPGKGFKNNDSFTYTVSDGVDFATAVVTVALQKTNNGVGPGKGKGKPNR